MEKEEDIAAFKDYQEEAEQAPSKDKAPAPEKKEKEPAKQEEAKSKSEPSQQQASAPAKKESPPPAAAEKKSSSASEGDRVVASPLARKLAEEKGVDLQVTIVFLRLRWIHLAA